MSPPIPSPPIPSPPIPFHGTTVPIEIVSLRDRPNLVAPNLVAPAPHKGRPVTIMRKTFA